MTYQNNPTHVTGFARDLSQPALRKAREWGIQTQIGILAGFGRRTTSMDNLKARSNSLDHEVTE